MTRLGRSIKTLLVAGLAAMALSALVASAASAEVIEGEFSSSTVKFTASSITVKRNGIEAKTCTPYGPISGSASGELFSAWNQLGAAKFTCSGPELFMHFHGEATYDTVAGSYGLRIWAYRSESQFSPWGNYFQEGTPSGTWVNGSGATPSKVTFVNQTIGYDSTGKKITIDGTFTATTSTGALLTLTH